MLQHLSSTIVVKESKTRYQREQFNRMINAQKYFLLQSRSISMEQFCVNYAKLIEDMIAESHNYKCPKIQANYDDFGENTVRPLNSTIFYFYFSGDRFRRMMAQWMLASLRYPNEKVKKAYMRFFA